MSSKLILGTRGSALALWQARHVAAALQQAHPDLDVALEIVRTEGDDQQRRPLGAGDVGVFVRRIEQALIERRIDLAVHSMKDLPSVTPEGLEIAAVPRRHDPRDALLSAEGWDVAELPQGARVGTGSPRRRSQLLHRRPDLDVRPVRGNVDTRIAKLLAGRFDALVLAVAGIERLQLDSVPMRPIACEMCLPAVAQGALAIEIRGDHTSARSRVAVLQHPASRTAVDAERAFLAELGGGCLAPATAHARVDGERIELEARVANGDGSRMLRDRGDAALDEAEELGRRIARRLIAAGAAELLEQARRSVTP